MLRFLLLSLFAVFAMNASCGVPFLSKLAAYFSLSFYLSLGSFVNVIHESEKEGILWKFILYVDFLFCQHHHKSLSLRELLTDGGTGDNIVLQVHFISGLL